MRIGSAGELRALHLDRWSDLTEESTFTWIPFEGLAGAERSFGDYTIPSEITATWWAKTDREFQFFQAAVRHATFSP